MAGFGDAAVDAAMANIERGLLEAAKVEEAQLDAQLKKMENMGTMIVLKLACHLCSLPHLFPWCNGLQISSTALPNVRSAPTLRASQNIPLLNPGSSNHCNSGKRSWALAKS